jgi:hypothetical protein
MKLNTLFAILLVFCGAVSAQISAKSGVKSIAAATFTPDKNKQPFCALQFEEIGDDGATTIKWISSSIESGSASRFEYSAYLDRIGGKDGPTAIIFDLRSTFQRGAATGWHGSQYFAKVLSQLIDVRTGDSDDVLMTFSTREQKFRLRYIYSKQPIQFSQQ